MSTEAVKKTKAPAKPKAVKTPESETGSAVKAAPKAVAKTKAKVALKTTRSISRRVVRHRTRRLPGLRSGTGRSGVGRMDMPSRIG